MSIFKTIFAAIIAPIIFFIVLGLFYLCFVYFYFGYTASADNQRFMAIKTVQDTLIKNDICKNDLDCTLKGYEILSKAVRNSVHLQIYNNVSDKKVLSEIQENLINLPNGVGYVVKFYEYPHEAYLSQGKKQKAFYTIIIKSR